MEITTLLSECIRSGTPVSFSKYGDGEYACANSFNGHNCDIDFYTDKKKIALIESFKYMAEQAPNSFISYWTDDVSSYWKSLTKIPVRWAKVHTLILDDDYVDAKIQLYKTIKQSPLKKIYICNPLMEKARTLLNIDLLIHIPMNNWFDELFEELIHVMKQVISEREQYIIMCSAGMSSKIIICELTKLFPNNIYLDIGSALDTICTKRVTRDSNRTYEKVVYYLQDILPSDWNDPKYDYIYDEAKNKMGLHMGN
jgi:hypothetical protein